MSVELFRYKTINNIEYWVFLPNGDLNNIIFDNADSNKYAIYNNIKFYNSAVCHIGTEIFHTLLLDKQTVVQENYTGAPWANTLYTTESNNNVYTRLTRQSDTGYYYCATINNFSNEISNTIPIFDNYQDYYNYITTPVTTYTWQSVPSISGKNGILNLSQIASASINNGESVTGASASAFTSLTAQVSTMVTDDSAMSGADAGGISGSGSNSGNQSSGYAFGQGESGTNVSGGGGGYYGGEKGGSLLSGGAGSGYIGNSLVSNKKMVGYNVPTSSAESTKTESVNVYSATKEANKPKAGNGFARVKFLRNPIDDYVALINGCNGEGLDFFWKDYTINFPLGSYTDPKTFSYYLELSSNPPTSIVAHQFIAGEKGGGDHSCLHVNKFSLWIVNDNDNYKLYFRDYQRYTVGVNVSSTNPSTGVYYRGKYTSNGGEWNTVWYANAGDMTYSEGNDIVRRSSASLVTLMEWCSKHFRNVNIYLDGVLISPAN